MSACEVLRVLEHDVWATAGGERPDRYFSLRFRTPVIHPAPDCTHVLRLVVCWPYADEGSGEMPSEADSEQMRLFENRLCDAWESDGHAFLAAVLTFDGARQWVFYTPDVKVCGERLTAMPQEVEPYPIELTTESDPSWSYLHDVILGPVDGWRDLQEEWKKKLRSRKR